MMNTTLKTDATITSDVIAELAWDPAVTSTGIDVNTKDGRVALSGVTDAYSSKLAAEDAAYRVQGVRTVTSDIKVAPARFRSDDDIELDVRSAIALDTLVPVGRVEVEVAHGIVTLKGNVDHYHQAQAAREDASQISGVKDIIDDVTLASEAVIAEDVADRITSAFARHAELFDDNVNVTIDGCTVTLGGTVATYGELAEAEEAAWRAPGVGNVINNIRVTHHAS